MKINKVFIILALLSVLLLGYLLNLSTCASCDYREAFRYCPELCIRIPRWKQILFDLTGMRIGYVK